MVGFHHRDPGLIGLLGRRDYTTRAHGQALSACDPASARPCSPDVLVEGGEEVEAPFPVSGSDRGWPRPRAGAGTAAPVPVRRSAMRGPAVPCGSICAAEDEAAVAASKREGVMAAPAPLGPAAAVPSTDDVLPQDRVYYSIIADGIHCHKYSVSMAHRLHPAGMILITDAMAAMGLPTGVEGAGGGGGRLAWQREAEATASSPPPFPKVVVCGCAAGTAPSCRT
jgi:hypothetical protein